MQTWEVRGESGGAPVAVTATDDVLYVALEDRVVLSRDDGATFTTYSE